MRPGFLNTCLASLYFLIASAASPRDKYREAAEHLPEVVKSVTQDLSKEPSCDELRAMWRFSKRQSRAAESTNEIPTFRDPFAYNVWEDPSSMRSVGGGKMRRPLVYGRLVHNGYQRPRLGLQEAPLPERIRGFEDFARMFSAGHTPKAHTRRKPTTIRLVGGNSLGQMQIEDAQPTSFQKLKQMIQLERARELHEQKLSEESAARESALLYQLQEGSNGSPGGGSTLVPYGRSRTVAQLDPVVNFPDVLAPSNDYYPNNYNYMQRSSYPDPLIQQTALVEASRPSGRPPGHPQLLDTQGDSDSSSRTQPSPSSSPIDEEIAYLVAKNTFLQPTVINKSTVKRGQLYSSAKDNPENKLYELDDSPLAFFLRSRYPFEQDELPVIDDEAVDYEPVNGYGSIFQRGSDPELIPGSDITYLVMVGDDNGCSGQAGSECPEAIGRATRNLEVTDMKDDSALVKNGINSQVYVEDNKVKNDQGETRRKTEDWLSHGNEEVHLNAFKEISSHSHKFGDGIDRGLSHMKYAKNKYGEGIKRQRNALATKLSSMPLRAYLKLYGDNNPSDDEKYAKEESGDIK